MSQTNINEELQRAIKILVEKDVGLYVSHDAPSGSRTVHLDAKQVADYAGDPVGFLAKRYNVTKEQYLGWHQSGYMFRCARTTSAKKQCKNIAVGGSDLEPKEWVEK